MSMRLNTLKPARGANTARRRVGRGEGSGTGGTAGRGHKGQKSRSGGYHKVGFEGGQMPLQRRLPKRGFRSTAKKHFAEIRLTELAKVEGEIVDLKALQKAGVIGLHITRAKAILSGKIERAVTLRGIGATKGAQQAIEQAGGTVETVAVEAKPHVAADKKAAQQPAKPKQQQSKKVASKSSQKKPDNSSANRAKSAKD